MASGIEVGSPVQRRFNPLRFDHLSGSGFTAADFLSTLEVRGPGGQSLSEAWDGEPSAFLGTTVPGFPNFFMLYGPNSNAGDIVFNLECQAAYVVNVVRRMRRFGLATVEIRRSINDRYNRWLQRQMPGLAWSNANNYYKSRSGRVVTQWPEGMILFWLMVHAFSRMPFVHHSRRWSRTRKDDRTSAD